MSYKVNILLADGSEFEEEPVFDTYEEAEDYGCNWVGDYRLGGEILHAMNPWDDEIDDEDPDFEILEILEVEETVVKGVDTIEKPDSDRYVPLEKKELDADENSDADGALVALLIAAGVAVVVGGIIYVSKAAYPRVKKWAQTEMFPAVKGKWAKLTKKDKKKLLKERCETLLEDCDPADEQKVQVNGEAQEDKRDPYEVLAQKGDSFDEMACIYGRIKSGKNSQRDVERYDLYLRISPFAEPVVEAALDRRFKELGLAENEGIDET